MSEHIETAIVGGGQAGLATAYHLRQRGRECVVLDAGARVGDAWRGRWPTLRLYSPARYDGLPGMRFPAPRHSFPSAAEMGDYLEAYARRFDLPVECGVRVERLSRNGAGYVLTAGARRLTADNVVVASGVQHRPFVPPFAGELDPSIVQLHSAAYRGPEQLQDGPLLVVGRATRARTSRSNAPRPTRRSWRGGRPGRFRSSSRGDRCASSSRCFASPRRACSP